MDARLRCASKPGSKRTVNITMNDDLIRQTRPHTRDPNGTPADLLQNFVERERAQRRAEDTAVDQIIDRLDAFHRAHGLISDEFSSL
jgi:hypothetical protein